MMFSTLSEQSDQLNAASAALVIVSLIEAGEEAWASTLKDLSERAVGSPVVILASTDDVDRARAAIRHGAGGYVPVTMDFEIAVAAIRIVLAGGTYVPTDHLLASDPLGLSPQRTHHSVDILSSRELLVVSAIKKGMANKAIAYDLNICESTVKVHVRNVMKKLGAKNRTDVAMRA